MTEEQMRQEIMLCIKANGLEVTGEMWLSLVFMTASQLRGMCNELHIRCAGSLSEKNADESL